MTERDASLLEHIMPIEATDLPYRYRALPHSPPHRTHLPPPTSTAASVARLIGARLAHIPSSATELFHHPPQALVRVAALTKGGDDLIAELKHF